MVNNGHSVQVDFEAGNTLVVDGATFTLRQVHFHAPSENQIAGRSFPWRRTSCTPTPQATCWWWR